MATIPKIDLQPFIDKLTNTGFKSLREADGYYLDCANAIYDTYEFLSELPPSNQISPDSAIEILAYFEKFKPQLSQLLDVLEENNFDCKNFDRLVYMLRDMEDDLPKLKKRLHKVALQSSK